MTNLAVTSIRVYPIKSCAGIELKQALVTPTGFAYDRYWMIVNEDSGKFISQRKMPRMALIQPTLPRAALEARPGVPMPPDACMTLSAPDQPDLKVPLAPQTQGTAQRQCTVWEWAGPALDEGNAAAAWLSSFLGANVRLVRYIGKPGGLGAADDERRRATDKSWAPSHELSFADGFPFLLVGEASLQQLNNDMDEALPVNRFRPNIVVSGAAPFEEDSWRSFCIGSVDFAAVKPCSRCKETTVNQETAEVGQEPLETLHRLRNGSRLGWSEAKGLKSWKHAVFFGINLVPLQSTGVIAAGQLLKVKDFHSNSSSEPPWQPIVAEQ